MIVLDTLSLRTVVLLAILALLLFGLYRSVTWMNRDWRTADRSSAGIAPLPDQEREAVVQIYSARAVQWRGLFAVHTWVATKAKNAKSYKVHQVIGWRLYRNLSALSITEDTPDKKWFGSTPQLLFSEIGPKAEPMVESIEKLSNDFKYGDQYRVWPGPNSNSFVSYLIRNTEGIRAELPPTAIGKDFLLDGKFVSRSESKTGFQFSLFGVFGFILGIYDGFEINLLGLSFGVDWMRPALKLPLIGRLGMSDQ